MLQGRVLDGAGQPVAGAWLTTLPEGHETQSASDGSYQFGLLPAGELRLVVGAAGWEAVETGPVVVEGGEITELDVVLEDALETGSPVEVLVHGPEGAPLAGLEVAVLGGDGRLLGSAETDATGTAALGVEADEAPRVVVADPSGRLLGRTLDAGPLTAAGGLQWSVALSGRADAGGDYIGSEACGACHPELYAGWVESAHARSLPEEPSAALRDRFTAGARVDLERRGATAQLSEAGGALELRIVDSAGVAQSFEVAGWIGDVQGSSVPWTDDGEAGWPLPVAWVAEDPRRAGWPAEDGLVVPFAVERWLDEDGRFRARAADQSAEASCLPCHATGFTVDIAADGGVELAASRGFGRWFEGAVGCERCHGAGAEHRSETATSTQLSHIVHPGRLDPARAADVCGQCHGSVESTETGHPWFHEDGAPFVPGGQLSSATFSTASFWESGAAASPHMQVEELAVAAHGLAGIACADCHDSHGVAGHSALLRAESLDNRLCLDCHLGRDFGGDPDQAEAHTQHVRQDPAGRTEGGRCTGCHMPATATTVFWNPLSGAGALSSHSFVALPPSETLAEFTALGASHLPVGDFPVHACADCHAWLAEDWGRSGVDFPGPAGDPEQRSSHEAYQAAFVEKYP